MLGDKRFLRTIKLRNILSFGPDTPDFELQSLNVLVGPNGAGKSNLIEAISLLQAAPVNFSEPVRAGGGIAEWLWKGTVDPPQAIHLSDFMGPRGAAKIMAQIAPPAPTAEIDVTLAYPRGRMSLRHRLKFDTVGQRAELVDEVIENERPNRPGEPEAYFYYRYQNGHPVLSVKVPGIAKGRTLRELQREDLALNQSIVSQRKDPDQYPELTYLGNEYGKIKLFREWNLGRNTPPRRPQPTDLPGDFLREDAANIALVLNDLEHRSRSE